ncbi:MAG: CbtB-domain containing protein [Spongiibacteraceae bacterium]|nr:CbtB-domain containing protein [Spongiibacteraceae bacterium]
MSIQTTVKHNEFSTTISTFNQTLGAMILGAIVVFCVGFLPMEAAHNAAHDTRHSLAFPCH